MASKENDRRDLNLPHWFHEHEGEHRFPVSIVVAVVILLQSSLPKELSLYIQREISVTEALMLLLLLIAGGGRIHTHKVATRSLSLALTSVMMLSNSASAVKLIDNLVNGSANVGSTLLLSGASIWLTNIAIFALWFWELDRGGPGARAQALIRYPDFLFPQMETKEIADPNWHPRFFDYLYISFTNASAFSPTDAMPLTHWAKLLMLLQSVTSLLTVGLVVARAVNILH